jgi:hypothetical protein
MAHQRGLLKDGHADPAAMPSTRASDYISNPLSKLPIRRDTFPQIREVCIALANEIEEKEVCSENMTPSLAAGVISFVVHHKLTKEYAEMITVERIASVCGVSEGTLQKCLKKIEAAFASDTLQSMA